MSKSNENENSQKPPLPQPPEAEASTPVGDVAGEAEKPARKQPKTKPPVKKTDAGTDTPEAAIRDESPSKEVMDTAAVAKPGGTTPADKVPPAKAAAPEPEPLKAGIFAQFLLDQGLTPEILTSDAGGVETIGVTAADLVKACNMLKTHDGARFDLLISIAGVDWIEHREVVYHLYSTRKNIFLALKVKAVDDRVPSVFSVWTGADWHERETYDMFGITFDGHPNLTRILMPDDWLGFPMRKGYKVEDPRLVWNER